MKKIINILLLLFVFSLISRICVANEIAIIEPDGPQCYLTSELDPKLSINKTSVTVHAIKAITSIVLNPLYPTPPDTTFEPNWVDSGVNIVPNSPATIQKITGTIDLCGFAEAQPQAVYSNINAWQPLNMYYNNSIPNIKFSICAQSGSVQDPDIVSSSYTSTSPNGSLNQGQNLYVYVGDTMPPESLSGLGTNLFHLYSEGEDGPCMQKTGTEIPSGWIWVRYKDLGSPSYNWGDNLLYLNNVGTYNMKAMTPCNFMDGSYLYYYVTDGNPNQDPAVPVTSGTLIKDPNTTGAAALPITVTAAVPSRLWFKIYDQNNPSNPGYINNSGSYSVEITAQESKEVLVGIFTKFLTPIIESIKDTIDTAAQSLFTGIASNAAFQYSIMGALTLFIIITAISYIMGLTQMSQLDLVTRIIKFATVALLLSPIGADGLTPWGFFYKYLFSFFKDGSTYLINVMVSMYDQSVDVNATIGGKSVVDLSFIDRTWGQLFTEVFWIKVIALLCSGIMGFVMSIVLIIAVIVFFVVILKAVAIYVFSIVGIGLLMALGPIFIAFLLFQQTKNMFENWIKLMLNYALQPVFVFAVIVLFNYWVESALNNILGFAVCKKCLFGIKVPLLNLPSFCLIATYLPWGYDSNISMASSIMSGNVYAGIPNVLFTGLIIIILAKSMSEFFNFASSLAYSITNVQGGGLTGLVGGAGNVLGSVGSIAMSAGKGAPGAIKGAAGAGKGLMNKFTSRK